MKKKAWTVILALIILIIILKILSPSSIDGKSAFNRKWIDFPQRSIMYYSGLKYDGERLWIEYPLIQLSKGKIVSPAKAIILDASGIVDGNCSLYYVEGPFGGLKAIEYPYQNGRIIGVASYWDNNGNVIRQEKWSDARAPEKGEIWMPEKEDIVEVKTSPPWWNNVNDQIPPNGVYTKTRIPYSPCHAESVFEQRRYQKGKLLETRDKAPWLEPDPGFWKAAEGIIIYFPGAGDKGYVLNGKALNEGQVLKVQHDGPKVKIHFDDKDHWPRLKFELAEDYEGRAKGSYVDLVTWLRFE